MPTTSVAPTVAARLKTLMQTNLANLGLDSAEVKVYESLPLNFVTWDNCIIGDQVDGVHDIHSIRAGRKHRDETYIQHVHFIIMRPGENATDARVQAYRLLEELEDVIADDPGIGLSIPTLVVRVVAFTCNTTPEPESMGWRAHMRADVAVSVRLT